MIRTINASIKYDTDTEHPDTNGKAVKGLVFDDIYTIDTDYFYDNEAIKNYITNDLKLVAGGGYNSEHIKNVSITIMQA